MLISQIVGLLVVAIAAPILGGVALRQDYIWGGIGGVLLLLGIAFLIFAFRRGPITVAAPVIGVICVIVPALYSLVRGAAVDGFIISGLCLAIAGIVLVNHRQAGQTRIAAIPVAASVAAGVFFGGFSIAMSFTSQNAGLWPLVISYAARLGILAGFLWCTGQLATSIGNTGRAIIPIASAAGVVVSLASASYLASLQHGASLVVASTISSEAPAVTVLLAVIVTREKLYPLQMVGLVASAVSMVLIGMD